MKQNAYTNRQIKISDGIRAAVIGFLQGPQTQVASN